MLRSPAVPTAAIAIGLTVASTAMASDRIHQVAITSPSAARVQSAPSPPALLAKVHRDVMAVAHYVPDPPGHDVWRASTEGDCEDLALEMGRRLEATGVPHRAIRIVVTWNRRYRQWHASLLVRMGGSAWRLDSLKGSPVLWDGHGIEFEVAPQGHRVVAINGVAVKPTPWRR